MTARSMRRAVLSGGGDDSYLASVSDLMVGVLFVFLILLMAFALNFRQAEEMREQETQRATQEAEAAKEEAEILREEQNKKRVETERLAGVTDRIVKDNRLRARMLRDIQESLRERGIEVRIDEQHGILHLPQELLFDSGSADFSTAGVNAIAHLSRVLAVILPCYTTGAQDLAVDCPSDAEARLDTVLIEGHTDDVPMKQPSRYADNWDLSVRRALNTYRALIEVSPVLDVLSNPDRLPVLSLSAFEARRPVNPEKTEAARYLNRRIDLRFIMSGPPPELINEARERLAEPNR